MTSTLPRRTAAVTALAVTAFSGIAITAAATGAAATTKAHTSLSIRSAKAGVAPGAGDRITGNLNASKGHQYGRKVELESKAVGATAWTKYKEHRTGRKGEIAFQVVPVATTRYMLVFAGNKKQDPSHSGVVVVHVRSKATSLTATASDTSITAGAPETISGVLSRAGTPISGATVILRGATGKHKFATRQTGTTASDGGVSFSVTPASTTHYDLVFKKTASVGAARSAVVTVHVLAPSSLSIRARAEAKKGKEVISGFLRGSGKALGDRRITLQDRASGATTWTKVKTKRSGKNGGVTFTRPTPTTNEDYRLVFSGGVNFAGSQSGVVTVTVA